MKNHDTQFTEKIRMPEKLGFLSFSTSTNIVYQFKSLYYLFFLTNVLKLDVLVAGTILALGTVWDAINDPLIGYIAVNYTFKNGEKVRPYALVYAFPWAVSIVLLFCDFQTGPTMTVVLCSVFYFLFAIFYTFAGIPYNAMGALATSRDEDRRSINSWRSLGGCIGSGVGAVACLPLVRLFGGLDAEGNLIPGRAGAMGFTKTAILMGVIVIVGSLLHYYTAKERVKQIQENEEHIPMLQLFKMLLTNRGWVLNMLYILCYCAISTIVMTSITYYATYVIGSTAAATTIQAAYLVTAVVFSLLVGPIDKALGRKKTMILAAVVLIAGKIPFIIDPYSTGAVYCNAISVGIGLTISFVMFNTNRNNITDLIEWDTGRRIDSLVSTGDNLAAKIAQALATQLMAFALAGAGFDESLGLAQTDATISTINALLGWVPGILAALMLVVVAKIDIDRDMEKMNREKAEK